MKEELEYFKEDLHNMPIFQEMDLNYDEFDAKLSAVIVNKCEPFLVNDNKDEHEEQEVEDKQTPEEVLGVKNDEEE